MRRCLVCASILIAAAVAPHARGQDALDAIDACVRRLDPQTDVGYERVAARCPDLTRRLQMSSWATWLPREWKTANNDLSAASLRELRLLVARELAVRTTSRTPPLAPLKPILFELAPAEPQQAAAWTRLTRRLRQALESDDPSAERGWLDRLLARVDPSQAVIDLICYAGLAAVVAIALVLIVNELRVAGAFDSRHERASAGGANRSVKEVSGWDVLQSATPGDRPRLLLEMIAARLMELNRLPPAAGLTVRELLKKARFGTDEERSLLADIARAAERLRFSAEPMSAASLDVAVERGRRLLGLLEP